MKSLIKITENIVEKNLSRLGSIQNHIFFNWAHIAGQYADITIPHKIKFGRRKNIDGIVTIKVQMASDWKFNTQFHFCWIKLMLDSGLKQYQK